jgi:TP901 family phage tail tape measure protein
MAADAFLIGQLIAQLGLDSTEFNAGMAAANAKMQAADAAMTKVSANMQRSLDAVGRKMEKVGKNMTKFVTLPILAAGAASFKAQKDFEASMSKIEGLVGVAAEEVANLSDQVLNLAPNIGRGPAELADALFFIESAGLRGSDAMDTLEMSAKASVAGLGETKVIADLVTSAMNAYGKENLNAAMATDILTAAVREGKAEADAMAGALGVVLPIASEMGVNFNQVGAAFAGMTRTGTPASIAATQLKAVMAGLLKPTEQAEEALMSMGLSSAGLRQQIREEGLISTLETLRKTTNQYGEEAMAKVFPNIRALMGVLDLMGANMESNIAISERMADATGSLEHAFQAAAKTTQFTWDQAIAQVQTTFVKLGTAMKDLVLPVIQAITERISNFTDRLDSMSKSEKEAAVKAAALAAAMGPVLTIMGKLIKLIAANPYTALAMAIAAIVIGTIKWVKTNRELFDSMSGIEKANKDLQKQYSEQSAEVRTLVRLIENENLSNEARLGYIEKLKGILPGYNAELTEEGELIGHNTDKINEYLDALKERIRLQVYEEEYTELLKKRIKLEEKIAETTIKAVARTGPGAAVAEANLARLNLQYDRNEEAIKEMDDAAKNLNITLGKTPETTTQETETVVPSTQTPETPAVGGGIAEFTQTQLNRIEYFTDKWKESQDNAIDDLNSSWEDYMTGIDANIQAQLQMEEEAAKRRMEIEKQVFDDKMERAQMFIQMGQDIAYALGEAIGGQEGALKGMITTMLSGVERIIGALLSQAIAGYIAGKAAFPGGLIAAAAGVPLLIGMWNRLVPDFAAGGLVYGETIGRMGEYPGASSNPEVIAPLSDLKKYIGPFGQGKGQMPVVELRISGRDVKGVVDLETLLQNTY